MFNEQSYIDGRKALARDMLRTARQELGSDIPDGLDLEIERADTIAVIRSIIAEYGESDTDIPDDLYLSDILRKYIEPLIAS